MGHRLEVARDMLRTNADDLAPEDKIFIANSIVEEKRAKKARARAELKRLTLAGMIIASATLVLEHLFDTSWWHGLLSYGPAAIVLVLLVVFLILLLLFLPQTVQIAEWLTLAEREMNSLLRGWGGGYGNRIDVVKVRMTAFLLRELYEGNVRNAQLKIFNEFANGGKPYIAPGIRQLVGYDQFNVNDVKNNGFPPDAGVGWFPLWLTVELNRFPRNIVMIRADKSFGYNQKVIDELTRS